MHPLPLAPLPDAYRLPAAVAAAATAGPRADAASGAERPVLVIDTNIVLDLFVFDDAPAKPLRAAIEAGAVHWVATAPMRVELARVLGYPQIAPRLAFYGLEAADVLALFDRHARLVDVAPKAHVTCRDTDDQGFIDLAVAHRATLLSKDRAVLSMRRRLVPWGVTAGPSMAFPTTA